MLGLSTQWCLRLAFVSSLFAALMAGLELAFNVYALPLKESMNYTQTQVEVIASMGTIGMSLSCLETISTWLLGYKVTCLIIVICVPASSGLFALVVQNNHIFHSWPSVVCLLQLIMGTANNVGYVAVSRVCVELLPRKHTGKLVGLYMALACFGKVYFAGVMELFFTDDLASFFFFIAVSSTLFYGICFAFLSEISKNKEAYVSCDLESSNDKEEEEKNISWRDMLKSPFFHATFWPSVVYYGSGYACVNNLTSFAESAGVSDPLSTVFLLSIVIAVVRLTFGTIFDTFKSLPCGFVLMMLCYAAFIAAMVIGMIYLDKYFMFLVTIFIGIGMAPGLSIPVSMLLLRFGRLHYSAITGSFYTVTGISQVIFQILIGYFYDHEMNKLGLSDRTCVGRSCFFWAFAVLLSTSLAICISQIINSLASWDDQLKEES